MVHFIESGVGLLAPEEWVPWGARISLQSRRARHDNLLKSHGDARYRLSFVEEDHGIH